jgi:hypothetical protein
MAGGDLVRARELHEQGMAIRRELNETRTIVESRIALAVLALEEGRAADAEREARALEQELQRESDRALHIGLATIVARARLALGDPAGADLALTGARQLVAHTEQIEPRLRLALAEAEVDAARGQSQRARERLTALRASLAQSGMTLAELECRTALLALDRTEQRPTVARDLEVLRKDAAAHRAGLILRRIQSTLGGQA